jgi:hypothetical protein
MIWWLVALGSLAKGAMAEEEEYVTGAHFAYSFMLVFTMAFQMTIFYLVNWPDDDIRAYAWDIIGNTILIFTGVLTFTATSGVVDHYLVKAFPSLEGAIMLLQLIFWVSIMQLVIGWCSGYFRNPKSTPRHIESGTLKIVACSEEKLKEVRERNNECFGSLMGHITGFAGIHFFGYLQDDVLDSSPAYAMSASLLALVGLLALYRCWTLIRNYKLKPSDEVLEMWWDVSRDKENDVAGLCCSYLGFLAIRFAMVGRLPSIEGNVVATPDIAFNEMAKVTALAFIFACGTICILWIHHKSGWVNKDASDEAGVWSARFANIGENFCNMCVSWACLLNVKLFIRGCGFFESCEVIPARICVAFLVSYGAMLLIWVLDKADDWLKARNMQSEWMDNIITAIGLAVGFAWEQSFDTAVDDLGGRFENQLGISEAFTVWIKLLLSIILILLVLPAHRLHIQPKVMAADEKRKEENEKIKKSFYGQQKRSLHDELQGDALGTPLVTADSKA